MASLDQCLGARFVIGIAIAIEEKNRSRLNAEHFEPSAERSDLAFVKWNLNTTVGEHALARLKPQRPLYQRHMLLEIQIVGIRAVNAADLVNVTETFHDDERGLGTGTL